MRATLFYRVAVALALGFGTAHASDPSDSDTRTLASMCAACHGTHGQSVGGTPVLAGLPVSYFIKQMQDFKSGERPATVMHRHAKGLTDVEIEKLAGYFSAQKRHRRTPVENQP